MSWRCPECGSLDLRVAVHTTAKLIQNEDNFETELVGDIEWGEFDYMQCQTCDFGESSHVFKEEDDELETCN